MLSLAPASASNLLQLLLLAVAVAAFAFSVWSVFRAWMASRGYADFDRLGWKKWVIGVAVIAHMPAAAMPHVKAYFAGFGVFVLALLGLAASIAMNPAAAP